MEKSNLLELPPELIYKLFQFMPGEDLKNMALSCSALLNVSAPILYRKLQLSYEDGLNPSTMYMEPLPDQIENALHSSEFALGHVRKFYLRKEGEYYGDKDQSELQSLRAFMDMTVRLVLARFGEGKLESAKLDHAVSIKTFLMLLSNQKKLRSLRLGCIGHPTYLDSGPESLNSIPPLVFRRLESIEFSDIEPLSFPLVLTVLHENSSTLQKIKIGDRKHAHRSRREILAASDVSALHSLPFDKIRFLVLKKLSIVHSNLTGGYWEKFGDMVGCGESLSHIKLSCFPEPYQFIRKTAIRGTEHLKRVQLCGDLRYLWESEDTQDRLPQFTSLDTLLVQPNTFVKDEFGSVYCSRHTIRRLWVQISQGFNTKDHPSTSMLLDYSSPFCLSSERWPFLEELAIGTPSTDIGPDGGVVASAAWKEFPMLKSLKILRLLQWETTSYDNPRMLVYEQEIDNYVNRLYTWSSETHCEPPNLRIVVLETEFCAGCITWYRNEPMYYLVHPFEDVNDDDLDGLGICSRVSPIISCSDKEDALRVCEEIGCSTYLLEDGPFEPSRFWGD
ncbi:hypothetical protein TWF281_009728 [Arthrobotrys megalospora]